MQSELNLLGHIEEAQGFQVDPKRVAIVQGRPLPAGVAHSWNWLITPGSL